MFFFEKKNQTTFVCLVSRKDKRCTGESFLLLFFKK